MRHRRRVKHFSRKAGPRKALLRGLMISLVENGRIKTTLAKAKELRRHIEKSITLGKDGDLAARRLLLSRISNPSAVKSIVDTLSPRFQGRPGGYTRIIKLGPRPGDQAEMVFIEFVDYQFEKTKKKVKKDSDLGSGEKAALVDNKAEGKEQARMKKRTASIMAAKKKGIRKKQSKSRHSVRV